MSSCLIIMPDYVSTKEDSLPDSQQTNLHINTADINIQVGPCTIKIVSSMKIHTADNNIYLR